MSAKDCLVLGNAAGGLATTKLSHFGVKSLDATLELIRGHKELCPEFAML